MLAAEMLAARPDGADRAVARVTAWLLATSDTSDVATDRYPPLVEGAGPPLPPYWEDAQGYLEAVQWRPQRADPAGEPRFSGCSPLAHFVDTEETTDLAAAGAAGRLGQRRRLGAGSTKFLFMNTDTVVHLHRLPTGEDFALRARGSIGPDGIGVTTAEIFDRQGFVGTSAQTLLIQRRS